MRQEKLLTIREAALELGVTEKEIIDLTEQGKIPAYKIGGVYLRFKPEHVQALKQKISKFQKSKEKAGFIERAQDFFYFNTFYILTFLLIVLMLIIIYIR
ncbi:MAG: helix-turn-helix domain-containing protein [Candidatus Omnitrophota bacterium]